MKIICYNIGIKIDNTSQVIEYLKIQNADIVCLQEAVRPLETAVFPIYRSEEEIRVTLKNIYPYYFFAPEWVADKFTKLVDGKNIVDRDLGGMAEQGKLILSKYPIVRGYNYFYYKAYEFECDRTKFYEGDDHGRALQVAEIDVNGVKIQIGNVHGSYSSDKLDNERSLAQSSFIVNKLKEQKFPTILLGDFNVLPETKSIETLNSKYVNLNDKFKIINTRPKGQIIDYVFTSKEFLPKNLEIGVTNISDHYPMILDVDVP